MVSTRCAEQSRSHAVTRKAPGLPGLQGMRTRQESEKAAIGDAAHSFAGSQDRRHVAVGRSGHSANRMETFRNVRDDRIAVSRSGHDLGPGCSRERSGVGGLGTVSEAWQASPAQSGTRAYQGIRGITKKPQAVSMSSALGRANRTGRGVGIGRPVRRAIRFAGFRRSSPRGNRAFGPDLARMTEGIQSGVPRSANVRRDRDGHSRERRRTCAGVVRRGSVRVDPRRRAEHGDGVQAEGVHGVATRRGRDGVRLVLRSPPPGSLPTKGP